jgi:hypothetical protein
MSLSSLQSSLSSTTSLLSAAQTTAQTSFKTMVLSQKYLQDNASTITSSDYTNYTSYKSNYINDYKTVAQYLGMEKSILLSINAILTN